MFLDLFKQTVKHNPELTALSWQVDKKNQSLTYHALDDRSTQMAHYLKSLGIIPAFEIFQSLLEEPIIVIRCNRNNPYWLISAIASWKAGAAIVLLDKTLSIKECIRRIEDLDRKSKINCKVIIDDEDTLFTSFKEEQGHIFIQINEETITKHFDNQPIESLEIKLSPHYLAYIAYTSSTSSLQDEYSKAVAINHDAAAPIIAGYKNAMKIKKGDRMLQASSFHFDPCIAEIFCLAMQEAAITLVLPTEPDSLLIDLPKIIKEHDINLLTAVPEILEQHINYLEKPLRHIMSTGEAGRQALFKQLREQGVEVSNGYGPTEHGVGTTTAVNRTDSIGNPMPGKSIYLCKCELKGADKEISIETKVEEGEFIPFSELKDGDKGEIVIAGQGLSRGYVRQGEIDEERTNKNFCEINDPHTDDEIRVYFTGDMGEFSKGLQCKGRLDSQFKLSGVRLEPVAIALAATQAVKELTGLSGLRVEIAPQKVTFANGRSTIRKTVGFIIIPEKNSDFSQKGLDVVSIRKKITKDISIPFIAIPTSYYLLPETVIKQFGLRTATKKIRYRKLAGLLEDSNFISKLEQLPYFTTNDANDSLPILSPIEERIITICREVLGFSKEVSSFSLSTDLSDYGATSLDIIPLKQALGKEFSIDMHLPPILNENLTIEKIIAHVVRKIVFQACYSEIKGGDPLKKSIFCVHPLTGECTNFLDLKILTHQRLVGMISPYVLEVFELEKALPLKEYLNLYVQKYECSTIEEMAAFILYSIQRMQSYGPYYIAGFSAGGNIVLAITELLRKMNEPVEWLGLFDPPMPNSLGKYLSNNNTGLSKIIEIVNKIGKGLGFQLAIKNISVNEEISPESKIKELFKQVREELSQLSKSIATSNTNLIHEKNNINLAKASKIYIAIEKHLLTLIKYECNLQVTHVKKACLYSSSEKGILPIEKYEEMWLKYIPNLICHTIGGEHMRLLKDPKLHEEMNYDMKCDEEFNLQKTQAAECTDITSSDNSFSVPQHLGQSRHILLPAPRQSSTIHIENVESVSGIEANAVTESPSIVVSNSTTKGALTATAITSNLTQETGIAVSNILSILRKK